MGKHQIKQLRKSLKLDRKEFGKLVGVSYRTVESWELGSRNPSKSVKLLMIKLIK